MLFLLDEYASITSDSYMSITQMNVIGKSEFQLPYRYCVVIIRYNADGISSQRKKAETREVVWRIYPM
jgi:hypothetical protein